VIVTRLIPAVVFVAISLRGRVCGLSPFRLDGLRHQRPCRRAAGPGSLLARTGLFHRFILCVDCGVRHVGAQSHHPLSSRKNRFGGSRCRRGDAFGSAHGRRLLSDRLLWITDASRLPEPVRRQSLGLRQTLNGLGDSDFRQLRLLVPFATFRAEKHLHGRLLLSSRNSTGKSPEQVD
jgi:hypothetical protein